MAASHFPADSAEGSENRLLPSITGRELGVLASRPRVDWGEMTGIIVSAALLIGGALLMLVIAMRS